jgi:hypothetical protein
MSPAAIKSFSPILRCLKEDEHVGKSLSNTADEIFLLEQPFYHGKILKEVEKQEPKPS